MNQSQEPQPKPPRWLVIASFTFGVIPALVLDVAAVLMIASGVESRSPVPLIWGAMAVLGTAGLIIAPWRPGRWTTAMLLWAGILAMAAPLVAFLASFEDALTSLPATFLVMGPMAMGAVHLGRFVQARQNLPAEGRQKALSADHPGG